MTVTATVVHALIGCVVRQLIKLSGTPGNKFRSFSELLVEFIKPDEFVRDPSAKRLEAFVFGQAQTIDHVCKWLAVPHKREARLAIEIIGGKGKNGKHLFGRGGWGDRSRFVVGSKEGREVRQFILIGESANGRFGNYLPILAVRTRCPQIPPM